MSTTLLLAGALLAQTAAPVTVTAGGVERFDVAYEELMAGQNREAADILSQSHLTERRDPCALINLGTAHARLGNAEKAATMYRAAIASRDRYDLQLADGSWMDSRQAARKAVSMLERGAILALR